MCLWHNRESFKNRLYKNSDDFFWSEVEKQPGNKTRKARAETHTARA